MCNIYYLPRLNEYENGKLMASDVSRPSIGMVSLNPKSVLRVVPLPEGIANLLDLDSEFDCSRSMADDEAMAPPLFGPLIAI